jgi:hypothetical protein
METNPLFTDINRMLSEGGGEQNPVSGSASPRPSVSTRLDPQDPLGILSALWLAAPITPVAGSSCRNPKN